MAASSTTTTLRRSLASLIGLLLALAASIPAQPARAAEPNERAGAQHLADTVGGSPNDFGLLHHRTMVPDREVAPLWSAKYVDHRSGAIHVVYRDEATGITSGPAIASARMAEADASRSALEAKGDDELIAAVAEAEGSAADVNEGAAATLPVGVWLAADVAAAEQEVEARHPELVWEGGRPFVDDLVTARAIRAELASAQAAARATAFDALRAAVAALGGSVAYESSSAPLAYVDIPATSVEGLAELESVETLGLERTWTPTMSTAAPTVEADWTDGPEDLGSGARVAVVEYHNVRNSGDLAGRVVSSYSTSGSLAYTSGGEFDHPTWVAGAVASQSGSFPGVAPGAVIVSASTGGGGVSLARDRDIMNAADWAAASWGGDADIINASIGQDTATGSEEARRYFDTLVHDQGRLAVAAAGNFVTFGHWNIVSPGTALNVLTVGGLDDRGTAHRGDDRLWYYPGSNGSNYHDPAGTAWNTHGDFNKPNVSAPAPSVRTANGLTASGTSVASPIVAGIAAQLLARAPSLAFRPEATRAIIMASAIYHTPMPDGSLNADHEGTGSASAAWANRLLATIDTAWGGTAFGTMSGTQTVAQSISVVAGQRVKVVVSWNGRAGGLASDLDLRVVQPNGSSVGSYSFDNNYEWVEFVATHTGTARIEVRSGQGPAATERFGLAWAKTSPFWDIDGSAYYSDIIWIAERQITLGCGGGRYCPADVVTRQQMASFLVRALGLPASGRNHYDDDDGSAHEAEINALAESGITVGCAPRQFCPGSAVSRQQMASFLVRGLGLPPSGTNFFNDDDGSVHEADINALAASGITNGCAAGAYCPHDAVRRDHMAVFLRRGLAP